MLKIRLQGTKEDIDWFRSIISNHQKIEIEEFSDCYANKGTKKYFRAYVEVSKPDDKSNESRETCNMVVNS